MKYISIGLIVAFTALVMLFKFQNLETATTSLFSASITLPVSIPVIAIYALGMATGGSLVAVLRTWVRNAPPPDSGCHGPAPPRHAATRRRGTSTHASMAVPT